MRHRVEEAVVRLGPGPVAAILTAAAALVCLALALGQPRTFALAGDWALDQLYAASLAGGQRVNDVVVVTIDARTFAETGRDWTRFFPCFTDIVKRLTAAKARVVAFDVGVATAPDDAQARAFTTAVAQGPPFVLASALPRKGPDEPARPVGASERTVIASPAITRGFVDLVTPPVDGDTVRRVKLAAERDGKRYASFALTVWARATGQNPSAVVFDDDALTLGPLHVDLEDGHFRIPYLGATGVPAVSCADLLAGRLPDELFKDRVVLLGPAEAWFHDDHATPVGRILGVQIHAAIIHALLAGGRLHRAGPALTVLAVLGAALLGFVPARRCTNRAWALVLAVAGALTVLLASMVAVLNGVWLPFLAPLGALAAGAALPHLSRMAHEALEGLTVKRLFGQFVSREVLETITREHDALRLGGTTVQATVLFSDIRGFTSMSERLGPEQTFAVLNAYMAEMVTVIFRHGGRLDKFIGDAIMAVWGAPVAGPDDALRACKAALEMGERLRSLNKRFEDEGRPPLAIGVGICTGPVQAGLLGASEKLEYAVIGGTVNTASRLESLTKEAKTPILLAESTYQAVKDQVEAADLGERDIRGLPQPLRVYGLMDLVRASTKD